MVYRPSADRAEYNAAVAGGYSDRLAEIFRLAAERAAAAAAEAARTGSLPPWMLQNPNNDVPDVVDVTNYPVMQPQNPLDLEGDPLDAIGIDYPDRPESQAGKYQTDLQFDDFEAAAKAAIASNTTAYYPGPGGIWVPVTPREAYYAGLNPSADRMAPPVEFDDVPGSQRPGVRQNIQPGSQTEYDAQGNVVDKPYLIPERYPKDPITGEDLPPQVFMGYEGQEVDGPPGGRILSPRAPVMMDADAAKNFALLPRDLTDAIVSMANAYYGRPVDPSWIRGRWAEAVDESVQAYQLSGVLIEPLAIYDELIAGAAAAEAAQAASSGGGYYGSGGFGGGGGGGTVNLTNYTNARAILNAAMSAWLGRQASDKEVSTFLKLLNEQEMANPVTQEFAGDIVIQSGGFDPQQFAEDFVKSQEGSAEYQAVTTYLDAFLAALGGKVGVL